MKSGAAPLRFLMLVIGGWIAARVAFLAPGWIQEAAIAPAETATVMAGSAAMPLPRLISGAPPKIILAVAARPARPRAAATRTRSDAPLPLLISPQPELARASLASPLPSDAPLPPGLVGRTSPPLIGPAPGLHSPPVNRWSLSTWAFIRPGDGGQLASGGQLGGSQAGARALFRMNDRLALSARLYTPLDSGRGAEAALGVEIQPLRRLPLRILAERRQAIGAAGRSAFALLVHGGIDGRRLLGPVTVDAYAQAGVVGLESRDGFVDGSVRFNLPVSGELSIGAGTWGAAQPGVSRLDVGPQASYRLPLGNGARISAEWRVRVGGNARPPSGPALTLATDF